MHWVHETIDCVQQAYDCIDAFGASGRVKDTWLRAGFQAIGFDIKLSPDHDLTSETGFKALVKMGLKLKQEGILICAPPYSLFGPACSSIHRRTRDNPAGDQSNFKVRLAQRIWKSFAVAVGMITDMRPDLFVVIEQPSGSWAFKQDFMLTLIAGLQLLPGW
ncbi:unnamed protein product [Cladocopium goreaui]|uniref:Uncharacterized protein n=1 Tax=Cladocopium goreaui TaxID=2562237 RepID=A0A9P1DM64_9DINO|nr:unnamed protein product [Cladocopium goreaui]